MSASESWDISGTRPPLYCLLYHWCKFFNISSSDTPKLPFTLEAIPSMATLDTDDCSFRKRIFDYRTRNSL